MKITKEVIERIYSGWLGKVIGVRLGSPIEGMWYNRIKETYGEITGYLADYDFYAADDDTNGPLFFLRGLSDGGRGKKMTSKDVGDALLNYAPYEHGFFWWGGYGVSTEHTAYLNLASGVGADRSGSVGLNGATVAEQIGGQIFIDTWGLVAPGDPDLAARLAEKAASVTHGGNGVYGGIFVAACISYAFIERDIKKIIEKGLSYIPADCEYTRVVRAVEKYHGEHPDDWRGCYKFVCDNFGYDRYPGNCHIIPNAAVVVLSLLYGEGDYSKTVCISCMCGWDTDCNAGNVGTIAGVVAGLDKIDEKWIKPINDLMISSSVVGSLNISDLPSNVLYIARLAAELRGEKLPPPYGEIAEKTPDSCHFELPRSTHAINVVRRKKGEALSFEKKRYAEGEKKPKPGYSLENTDKTAHSGNRSLKIKVTAPQDGEEIYVFKRTYYHPSDFTDSRYDPSFSPVAYPGQTVSVCAYIPGGAYPSAASAFYYDERHEKTVCGKKVSLVPGEWNTFALKIPRIKAGLVTAVGICFNVSNPENGKKNFVCNIDDLEVSGRASYTLDFAKEKREYWNWRHVEVSQFTRQKGIFNLEDGAADLSGPDCAEAYTGDFNWKDYECSFVLVPVAGSEHYVNVRVQGAMRSYAVGFCGSEFRLMKNRYGYKKLAGVREKLSLGEKYTVTVAVKGNVIKAALNGKPLIEYKDEKSPILSGGVGISNRNGSHTKYLSIDVK